jgi:hypothetical protein
VRKAHRFTALARNLFQKWDRKIFCGTVIKRVFIAQTVAAMQIADVRQFHAGALRPVRPFVHVRKSLQTENDDCLETALVPSCADKSAL